MEPRGGTVVEGKVVLDEGPELEDGTRVTVVAHEAADPVHCTEEELALIRQGLAAADRGELLNARDFLRQLRNEG